MNAFTQQIRDRTEEKKWRSKHQIIKYNSRKYPFSVCTFLALSRIIGVFVYLYELMYCVITSLATICS